MLSPKWARTLALIAKAELLIIAARPLMRLPAETDAGRGLLPITPCSMDSSGLEAGLPKHRQGTEAEEKGPGPVLGQG